MSHEDTSVLPPEMLEIQRDVVATRIELGATVDELTRRMDVKSRVRQHVTVLAENARTELRRHRAQLAAGGAAAVGLLLVIRARRHG